MHWTWEVDAVAGFGDLIREKRAELGWTIKEFLRRLETATEKAPSPAFITRVEQYGEIPGPDLIIRMAEALNLDVDCLLKAARQDKVEKFDKGLEDKYQKAAGLYRKGKR